MASAVFLVEGAEPGRRGWMGSWGPFGASAGTLLGSAAGAVVNLALPPEAVLAWGWRIPFAVGVLVALGGLWIRRHYVERVPQQMPAKSPVGEAFRSHWRTMVHLVFLIAGLSVGFYTTFVYSAIWLQQIAQVSETRAFEMNTIVMTLLLVIIPLAGIASDRFGRRRVLAWAAGGLTLLAWPLMALMARGTPLAILGGSCWSETGRAAIRDFLLAYDLPVGVGFRRQLGGFVHGSWRTKTASMSVADSGAGFFGTKAVAASWSRPGY